MSNGLMQEKKSKQLWLWYVLDRESKKILSFVLGKRTDENCKKLFEGLIGYDILNYYTDD